MNNSLRDNMSLLFLVVPPCLPSFFLRCVSDRTLKTTVQRILLDSPFPSVILLVPKCSQNSTKLTTRLSMRGSRSVVG
jgi:hypothetical protein